MLYDRPTTDRMSARRPDSLENLHQRYSSYKASSTSKYLLSPTSTLSSGYESGCSESEIDDMLYSSHQQENECEYFELESDQYVCLDKPAHSEQTDSHKLQKVRDSMIKIVTDLESLGYETSLDELSNAVRSSIRLGKSCAKQSMTSSSTRRIPQTTFNDYNCLANNNNSLYTKSPADRLFSEMRQQQDAGSKEKLYDSLITNLALECERGLSAHDYSDEPIYEEIYDDSDFDFVSHSDTYRKSSTPPALPPRGTRSLEPASRRAKLSEAHRHNSTPCLTEVQKVTWNSGCRKANSWRCMSV